MTIRLLHIDSSILGPHSVSRELSAAVVERYRTTYPDVEVTYRNLAAAPLPHLSGPAFLAARTQQVPDDPTVREEVTLGNAVLDEFLRADVVVLGVAFYNFGIASQLKAWVDRIAVAGKRRSWETLGKSSVPFPSMMSELMRCEVWC